MFLHDFLIFPLHSSSSCLLYWPCSCMAFMISHQLGYHTKDTRKKQGWSAFSAHALQMASLVCKEQQSFGTVFGGTDSFPICAVFRHGLSRPGRHAGNQQKWSTAVSIPSHKPAPDNAGLSAAHPVLPHARAALIPPALPGVTSLSVLPRTSLPHGFLSLAVPERPPGLARRIKRGSGWSWWGPWGSRGGEQSWREHWRLEGAPSTRTTQ